MIPLPSSDSPVSTGILPLEPFCKVAEFREFELDGEFGLCDCKCSEFPPAFDCRCNSTESCVGGFLDCARVVTDISVDDAFGLWLRRLRRKIESSLPDGCEMTVDGVPFTKFCDVVPYAVVIWVDVCWRDSRNRTS